MADLEKRVLYTPRGTLVRCCEDGIHVNSLANGIDDPDTSKIIPFPHSLDDFAKTLADFQFAL